MKALKPGLANQGRFTLALVTGATSGIGLELCRLLASQGIGLIVQGRDPQRLAALVAELQGIVDITPLQADLAIPQELDRVVQAIAENQPDLVINNAGFGLYGDALDYPSSEQLEILQVNGHALINLTLEAARTLIAYDKQGVILNVSSVASFFVFPGFALYAASKALINQFSESFDVETKPYGVRILIACPGKVVTNFRFRAGGKERFPGNSEGDMSAEFAAEEIWKQIIKGKKVHIFNWRYRVAVFLSKYIVPKALITWLLKSNIKKIKSTDT